MPSEAKSRSQGSERQPNLLSDAGAPNGCQDRRRRSIPAQSSIVCTGGCTKPGTYGRHIFQESSGMDDLVVARAWVA